MQAHTARLKVYIQIVLISLKQLDTSADPLLLLPGNATWRGLDHAGSQITLIQVRHLPLQRLCRARSSSCFHGRVLIAATLTYPPSYVDLRIAINVLKYTKGNSC